MSQRIRRLKANDLPHLAPMASTLLLPAGSEQWAALAKIKRVHPGWGGALFQVAACGAFVGGFIGLGSDLLFDSLFMSSPGLRLPASLEGTVVGAGAGIVVALVALAIIHGPIAWIEWVYLRRQARRSHSALARQVIAQTSFTVPSGTTLYSAGSVHFRTARQETP